MKKIKAWAIVDDDGEIPDMDGAEIKGLYHIHTNKTDADRFMESAKLREYEWKVVEIEIREVKES